MLQLIRDKAQGIIIWIIVGLVILALSSFILNSYLGSSVKTYVAKVNDQEISQRDYQMAFNAYTQRMRQMLGDNFSKLYNPQRMRQTVISNLVRNELMSQMTKAAGFRISPQRVASLIASNPAFQVGGKFSSKRYHELLQQNGYSPTQYESNLSHDEAEQQFENGISDTAFVLKSTAREYLRLKEQQRDVSYLQVNMAVIRKGVKISDSEIKQYYDSHRSSFMTKEQVQVSYLDLSKQELAKGIKVSDAEIQSYYNDHKANYTTEDYTAARKKIEQIAERIKHGASFAKMAEKYSQDPGSARKGGDLGFFSRNSMVKPFAQVAFSLKVGQVSKPVRTKFGYHLIKLVAVRDDGKQRRVRHILIKPVKEIQPLDKVRAEIKHAVQLQHADKIFYQDADKLDRLTYEYQDSLDPAAEKLGEKIKISPFFARQGGSGIWGNPDVVKAAFSDDVLKGGLNSNLIKISDNHMIVLRLKTHKPAAQKPLSEVKQQIQQLLTNQKATQQASVLADKLAKEIRSGAQADKLAAANPAVGFKKAGYIGRKAEYDANNNDKINISPEIRDQVFLLSRPQGKKPVISSDQLRNGDAIVLILHAVRDNPDVKDMDNRVAQIQQKLLGSESRVQENLLLQYERAHSKIEVNKEQSSDQGS